MPVIHAKLLPQRPGIDVANVMHSAGRRVAGIVGVPERAVWTTWEYLPPAQYAEGGVCAGEQPRGTHPPLVDLMLFEGRSADKLEEAILAIVEELTRGLQLDEGNVFVAYRELRSGRVFTGGKLRR